MAVYLPNRRDTLTRYAGNTLAAGVGGYSLWHYAKAINQAAKIAKLSKNSYDWMMKTPSKAKIWPRKKFNVKKALKDKKPINKIKKQIKRINKQLSNEQAIHTHRRRYVGTITGNPNVTTLTEHPLTITILEASMGALRYYNPATNALVTNDPTTGTYNREMLVEVSTKLMYANNFQVPVKVRVYICIPKEDTSIVPKTAVTNGLTDQGNPTATSQLVYPTDSDEFKALYRSKLIINKTLQPGQSFSVNHHVKQFSYDISNKDEHNLAFQRKAGGHAYLTRLCGVLAHDSVQDETGFSPYGIDYKHDMTFKFTYDAGQMLRDFSISDTSDTFTTAAIVSNKPVSDNQSYARS